MQLVTEGEVLQLQNGPTAKSAGKNRDDRTHELEHAADSMAAYPKTRLFGPFGVFSSHTGEPSERQANTNLAAPAAGSCVRGLRDFL